MGINRRHNLMLTKQKGSFKTNLHGIKLGLVFLSLNKSLKCCTYNTKYIQKNKKSRFYHGTNWGEFIV